MLHPSWGEGDANRKSLLPNGGRGELPTPLVSPASSSVCYRRVSPRLDLRLGSSWLNLRPAGLTLWCGQLGRLPRVSTTCGLAHWPYLRYSTRPGDRNSQVETRWLDLRRNMSLLPRNCIRILQKNPTLLRNTLAGSKSQFLTGTVLLILLCTHSLLLIWIHESSVFNNTTESCFSKSLLRMSAGWQTGSC